MDNIGFDALEVELPIFAWIRDQHGTRYESIREASRTLDIPRFEIILTLQGRCYSARGFHFCFDN